MQLPGHVLYPSKEEPVLLPEPYSLPPEKMS